MSLLTTINPSFPTARIAVSADLANELPSSLGLAQTAYDILLTPLGQQALLAVENNKHLSGDEYYDAVHTQFANGATSASDATRDLVLALAEQFAYGVFTVQTDTDPKQNYSPNEPVVAEDAEGNVEEKLAGEVQNNEEDIIDDESHDGE